MDAERNQAVDGAEDTCDATHVVGTGDEMVAERNQAVDEAEGTCNANTL